MIRINLLGVHQVHKGKERRWLLKGSILGCLLILSAALLGYWVLSDQIKNVKKEKETLEAKTRMSGALQREIQQLKAKKAQNDNKLALLQNLDRNRQSPVMLMDFLSTSLPVHQLWLIAIKERGPEIHLEGMSLTNEILADFMKRLEKGPLFKQVDLVQSTQAGYKNLRVKQFSLIAWTTPPPPPVPPQEKR